MPWPKKPDGSFDRSQGVEGRFAKPGERLACRWPSKEACEEMLREIDTLSWIKELTVPDNQPNKQWIGVPTMWPKHPLPVKRFNGTGTGVVYVNDPTVYQRGPGKVAIQKYKDYDELANDWRPE